MAETLARSSLGPLAPGDEVNLELPLRAADRLGGHVVQGHVDGTGTVARVTEDGFARVVTVEAPPDILRYIVDKGSIAVDGVSLTAFEVDDAGFSVSLIPETLERTTLGAAEPGRTVNLEVDVLAKYAEKAARARWEGERHERALQHHRGGDRGRPRREDGGGLRRGGPRERGRSHPGRPVRHAGGHQLHGHARARADLPGPHPRPAATSSAWT